METTLDEFKKNAERLIANAAARRERVAIKMGDSVLATVSPSVPPNRKAALEALRKIGPVELPSRK